MRRRAAESGFAMLLVFALAAAVGILLYIELPRAAFEAQRHREQLLIDRGEQYQRAIQLYFRKTRQFPANLEQLENTNNFRFLRRRYKDPITGKDEWRLIHIGPGGMLTDSLTQKPPELKTDKDKQEKADASGGEGKPELPSAATRRRASEMAGHGLPGSTQPGAAELGAPPPPGQEGQAAYPGMQAGQPYPPQTYPPDPRQEPRTGEPYVVGGQVVPPGQPQVYVPGMPPGQAYPVVPPGQPQPYVPGMPPGQTYPGMPPVQVYPGMQPIQVYPPMQPGQSYPVVQPGQVYPGAQQPYPYPQAQPYPYPQAQPYQPQSPVRIQVGQPGQPPPGFIQSILTPGGRPGLPQQRMTPGSQSGQESTSPYSQTAPPSTGGPSNPALEMIRKILTTPRPGGLAQAQGQQPFTYGAGIAGVASKAEADSIILYNERSRYNEWEFIYDLRKDRTMVGPAGVAGSAAGNLLQPPAGSSTTTSPMSPMTPTVPPGRGR